jgi:hypothetical protein
MLKPSDAMMLGFPNKGPVTLLAFITLLLQRGFAKKDNLFCITVRAAFLCISNLN